MRMQSIRIVTHMLTHTLGHILEHMLIRNLAGIPTLIHMHIHIPTHRIIKRGC